MDGNGLDLSWWIIMAWTCHHRKVSREILCVSTTIFHAAEQLDFLLENLPCRRILNNDSFLMIMDCICPQKLCVSTVQWNLTLSLKRNLRYSGNLSHQQYLYSNLPPSSNNIIINNNNNNTKKDYKNRQYPFSNLPLNPEKYFDVFFAKSLSWQ